MLGNRIKQAREEQGLNQSELARRAGVSPATINRIESGERLNPGWRILHAITRALGQNLVDLMGNEASSQQAAIYDALDEWLVFVGEDERELDIMLRFLQAMLAARKREQPRLAAEGQADYKVDGNAH